ncbi:MAG: UDP-N-acetylmuramoyl-L-alanyl-D-glutamate--2,6-diaminopimelate ligase [Candidatus Omnitrophica bacterium]|nr:UDP-N-acetylmuramoyl-L-alanyl-D-glutamate--2,6-diaminopimelate ligase [Candidatus Omnitrophota bacterium]
MKLSELLQGQDGYRLITKDDVDISDVAMHSGMVTPGSLFVALSGSAKDGHSFIPEAIKNGAAGVVVSSTFASSESGRGLLRQGDGIAFVVVEDPRHLFGNITRTFFGDPSSLMPVIGITGTNGKTTVSYLLERIAAHAAYTPGVLGTINYRIGSEAVSSVNTTPDIVTIHQFLKKLRTYPNPIGILEVSSHAIKQRRVQGIHFTAGVLTNVTSDHMDYHGSRQDYIHTKLDFFRSLDSGGASILNADDPLFPEFARASQNTIITYGIKQSAHLRAQDIVCTLGGISCTLVSDGATYPASFCLSGVHNLYNVLAAVATASYCGIGIPDTLEAIRHFPGAPGRMQQINEGQSFHVLVDYAHTADALECVLQSLRTLVDERLIVVFGCGGDRDRSKRPLMGCVADRYADRVYITNDNPRSEKPERIAEDILNGIRERDKVYVILDRQQAIRSALSVASGRDCVVIAGKGHEESQIVGTEQLDFNDMQVARDMLRQLCTSSIIRNEGNTR